MKGELRGGKGHFVANNCRQLGSPRTREAGKHPLLRLSSLGCGFIFSTSPGASVPSLPVGSLSLGCWCGCPKWWLQLEATGPPRSTVLGLGVPEKPIGLAWVRVSALSTQLGEAGPVVSGTGWEAVLGTDATMSAAFMMRGMFWGRTGKWGITLLESARYDGRGRPTAGLPKCHRIRSVGLYHLALGFLGRNWSSLISGEDGMAVPHASPQSWLGAEEAPPFGTWRLGSYFQCRTYPVPRLPALSRAARVSTQKQ